MGRVVVALVLLQLFNAVPYGLAGYGVEDPEHELHFCSVRHDWWAFLENQLQGRCGLHGADATRVPALGSDVSGPCLGRCGQQIVLRSYNPKTQNNRNLYCPACLAKRDATRA